MFFGGGSECTALSLHLNTTTEVPLSKAPNPQLLPGRRSINVCFHCCVCALRISDGEVKRSAPVKFSNQLYQKKFITRSLLKRFMLWPSSGLKSEQHLPKCCDSLQLLVSHLVLQLISCFNLLYKSNGHCQSHSFVVYCH